MKIARQSQISGRINVMDLDITPEGISRWQGGELIQNVFPHLTPEEREFLISGATKEEWDAVFWEPEDIEEETEEDFE